MVFLLHHSVKLIFLIYSSEQIPDSQPEEDLTNLAPVLGPVGLDLVPRPLVVGVVLVAGAQRGLGRLGLQHEALTPPGVVHLLVGRAELPRAGVVPGGAPLDHDVALAVGLGAPLAGGQLALRVQPEHLVAAEAVASRRGALENGLFTVKEGKFSLNLV